jgi:hypothetical protein
MHYFLADCYGTILAERARKKSRPAKCEEIKRRIPEPELSLLADSGRRQ